MHASSLTRVVTRLREGGVEPVLVKGPSIARLYPERGLRPFEDLDFCVDRISTTAPPPSAGGSASSPPSICRRDLVISRRVVGMRSTVARNW
jgi:hypothetical protein